MKLKEGKSEVLAEMGLGLFGALLLGAVGVLLGGRIVGGLRRGRRYAGPPPEAGSIPPSRHRAPAAAAAR